MCYRCNSPSSHPYLDPIASVCVSPSTVPSSKGIDELNKQVLPCQVVHCGDCRPDYQKCITCIDSPVTFYLDSPPVACLSLCQVSAGKGVDNQTKQVHPCRVEGCEDCSLDWTGCRRCGTAATRRYLQLPEQSCLLPAQMPEGSGPNLSTGLVEACKKVDCLRCSSDYSVCESVDVAGAPTTAPTTTPLTIASQTYDRDRHLLHLQFSAAIEATVKNEQLAVSVVREGSQKKMDARDYRVRHSSLDSLEIIFEGEHLIQSSSLFISNTTDHPVKPAAPGFTPFEQWPIVVEDFFFTPHSPGLQGVTEGAGVVLKSAASSASFVMIFDPVTASQLFKFFSNALYQRSLGGPFLLYPDSLLKNFMSLKLLPFNFEHPLESWMSRQNCESEKSESHHRHLDQSAPLSLDSIITQEQSRRSQEDATAAVRRTRVSPRTERQDSQLGRRREEDWGVLQDRRHVRPVLHHHSARQHPD